jgi:hypothetical protein
MVGEGLSKPTGRYDRRDLRATVIGILPAG